VSRNAVQALFDEWDRSRREIVALLPRIRSEELEGGDPRDPTRARGILIHVVRASYGYAGWICECLGFPAPQRRTDPLTLDGRAAFEQAFGEVRDYFQSALEPLTDAHVDEPAPGESPPHFRSRWGEDYGIEQMLEHAICHHLRHRRQLERLAIFSA